MTQPFGQRELFSAKEEGLRRLQEWLIMRKLAGDLIPVELYMLQQVTMELNRIAIYEEP